MWADYSNECTLVTLGGLVKLRLLIRRCPHAECSRYRRPYRPEEEGAWALPNHEVGLDVRDDRGAALRGAQERARDVASIEEFRGTVHGGAADTGNCTQYCGWTYLRYLTSTWMEGAQKL
jgi:hypothetical protein